jgi:uncharacterized protein DUF1996
MLALTVTTPGAAHAVEKRFSITCEFSHNKQVDPIVAPGPDGTLSSHEHVFFGNRSTDSDSTYESMVNRRTTCGVKGDTAGYWIPSLVKPNGQLVRPTSANMYYRSIGALANDRISPYPPDLRMLADDYHFHCGDDMRSSAEPVSCQGLRKSRRAIRLTIIFPACWNGISIDSSDHRSHMAYPTGKGCPGSHPVEVPRLAVIAKFPVVDARGYALTSGEASTGHGDFWNTWSQGKLNRIVDRCLGRGVRELCGHLAAPH